jgi:hypothetical protein
VIEKKELRRQLIDRIENEMNHMVSGDPIAQIRRHQ